MLDFGKSCKLFLLILAFCAYYCNNASCQNKGLDFNIYMSKPSITNIDDEFDFVASNVSPLFHIRTGIDIYSKKQRFVTLHLGTILGFQNHVKPSIYEGFFSNSPQDSTFIEKKKSFTFVSLGAEFKKAFNDNGRGIYLSVEPQFSFLVSSKNKLLIRQDNKVVTNESTTLKDELNSFNATLILGGGYELGLTRRFNIILALNIEFRPIQGYYKNDSHIWASSGITAGFRYLL